MCLALLKWPFQVKTKDGVHRNQSTLKDFSLIEKKYGVHDLL